MSKSANTLFYFSGAGNDFVVCDGRAADVSALREVTEIQRLCAEFSTDGLMILGKPEGYDFGMEFYNPDGSGGMMCGNGGRCIVAFASYLGLKPSSADGTWHFLAPDGEHSARILSQDGNTWTVRLKMIDVHGISETDKGYFLNTGTRHLVRFVPDVEALDMERDAKPLRWDPLFQPEGTNVNFVQQEGGLLKVRTFEKGVEGETLACGTGITASAIAAWTRGIAPASENPLQYRLQCRRGDTLQVEFSPEGDGFKSVFLTGPAELVKTI